MARRIRWQILIASVSALVVLGLMSFVALSDTSVARPLKGGTFVEGFTSLPRQLNPLLGDPARDPVGADMQALLFEGLMRSGVDGLPEPALAAAAPEVSADGTVYTFTLRPDVTWHDGAPFTADDVVFTLRAVQNRAFVGNPLARAVWRDVVVDKLDERTIRCTLPAPFAPFASLATFPVLPAHLLGDVPPEQWVTAPFGQQPVGTGPYTLSELNTERAVFSANSAYHGGRPFLDTIEFRFFNTSQEALAALNRGDVTGLGFLGTSELSRVNFPRDVVEHVTPLDAYTVLTFNLREAPLDDLGVRRALARGLDKAALIDGVLNGQVAQLDTPILPGWWAATDVRLPAPSQQAAADALDSLGYTLGADGVRAREGQPLILSLITDETPDRVATANEIARQWGAIGVRVEVETLDADQLRERLEQHTFTLALHGWQRLGPDPDVYELWHSAAADEGRNYAGLTDDQIDTLLQEARQEQDVTVRRELYAAFQRRWIDLVPSITLYQPVFVYATRGLEGVGFGQAANEPLAFGTELLLGREDRFRNVTRWFVRSSREIRGELRSQP